MTRLHYLLILLAVLLITAYAGWLSSLIQPGTAPDQEAARHVPDYFMNTVDATLISPEGQRIYLLRASRISHYPDDDSLEMNQPDLHYYPPEGPTWEVVSDSGRIYDDGARVFLDGAVNMTRPAGNGTLPLQLTTRDLLIRPRQNYAETAARAIITSQDSRLAGTGMQFYLAERRLELLANGEGHYVVGR